MRGGAWVAGHQLLLLAPAGQTAAQVKFRTSAPAEEESSLNGAVGCDALVATAY
jgi:hypothetical protein